MLLVLVRHGESVYNKKNIFTGWTDVKLTRKGKKEAKVAGKELKKLNIHFDVAYTSVLKRAINSLNIINKELNCEFPIKISWKLNERHYGSLQGLNKDKARREYGVEQVKLWRRSLEVKPPALSLEDSRFSGNDIMYKGIDVNKLPTTENLLDTCKRVEEYFNEEIYNDINSDKNILLVSHGNTIRAIRYLFEDLSIEELQNLEIPTGKPFVYEIVNNKVVKKDYI